MQTPPRKVDGQDLNLLAEVQQFYQLSQRAPNYPAVKKEKEKHMQKD